MNLSALFIRRPIATTLLMLALIAFGVIAYRQLPVSDLPNVDFPTIQVNASLPGASPETMASSVATPLEKQFSTIQGLESMSSSSTLGSTGITLQFALSRNIDAAAQDVQAAISAALRQLPPNMPAPPSFQKVNPAAQPILYLAVSSPTLPLSQVDEYAETLMAEHISMVSGVAQVSVFGTQKYAVRIQVNPLLLASRNLGIDQIATAVKNANVNLPTGTLWGRNKAVTLEASGQLQDAAAFRPMIVAYQNGNPVRLDEVANVVDSVQDTRQAAWYNGRRAMVLAIQRQPGTNTIDVVNGVKQLLPTLRREIPAAVNIDILHDRSEMVKASVNDVKFTLLLTIFLVILVIFLFLRNISATIIPSLALPLSILGTFAVMYLLSYSIDNLSLLALTLSVGFVVDDAIVMLENIVRHMEQGESPMQAAFSGSGEIGFTILSMTLSLTAVFIPFLFMGGILGRLLHEFAVTIASAVLVSGVVSLTLTPMLSSRFLRPSFEAHHGRFYEAIERGFQGMLHFYERTLRAVLRHPRKVMAVFALILLATIGLAYVQPMGFLPNEDQGFIFGQTEGIQGISFQALRRHQLEAMKIVDHDPYVKTSMSFVSGGSNLGRIFMELVPLNQRPPVDQVIQELRKKLSVIPGFRVFLLNPPPINIGGRLTKSLYAVTLQDPNTTELYAAANKLEAALRRYPRQLQDVTSDLQMKNPQQMIQIDRDRASALGVSAQDVESALYAAYGTDQVSQIYTPNNEYYVILELAPRYQRNAQALNLLYVHSSTGKQIPLSEIVSSKPEVGPLSVNHTGQLPSVTISFNLPPGEALGTALNLVNAVAARTLPANVTLTAQGEAQAFQQSLKGLGLLLLAAVLVIYIVLGILYESFIHPITILSGLVPAGFGALLMLWLFHAQLDIYAFVGIIMLVGLVKKNAIMMIDFALDAERGENKTAEAAIFQGCMIRFRPIMMTTLAAMMGTLPIAVGFGAGAAARRSLGLAVVGGLLFSQFITLYVTPVIYIYMDRFQDWSQRRFRRATHVPSLEPAPAEVVRS